LHAILVYGFPIILALFEWGLRVILKLETIGFIGPTFAAVGLSFLMPLTRPKKIEIKVDIPGYDNVIVTKPADQTLISFIWILILLYLFAWSSSVYISVRQPNLEVFGLPTHVTIGICAYAVSLVLVAVKEKI